MGNKSYQLNEFLKKIAWITLAWLVINVILILISWPNIFQGKESLGGLKLIILAGFILTFIFDIFIIIWTCLNIFRKTALPVFNTLLLIGGILCLLVLNIAKVMADEISRQTQSGLGATGEYVIFNVALVFLILFTIFSLVVLKKYRNN